MATFQNISKQHCDWVVLTYEIYDLENQCKNKLSNLLRSEVPFTSRERKIQRFLWEGQKQKGQTHVFMCMFT